MLSFEDIAMRMVFAVILGGIVGFEREKHSQPAGLRTHIILTLGAAVAMCISINISAQFKNITTNGDPERIAAQVVSGIGFLGAGAIFRFGSTVKGLTTAASLWTMAMVGLAVGAGYYGLSLMATGFVVVALFALDVAEKKFVNSTQTRQVIITASDCPGLVSQVKALMKELEFGIKTIAIRKVMDNNEIEVQMLVKGRSIDDFDDVCERFSKISGVRSFRLD